jgi:tetratricopeptide (TPR) repeat protein
MAGLTGPAAQRIGQLLQAGLAAQKAGRAAQAEQAYRQVLTIDPRNPDAWQLLGLLAKNAGRPDLAVDYMRRSLDANPRQPGVWSNLGNLHLGEQRAADALTCYDRAIALMPGNAEFQYHRGKALHAMRRLDEAQKACAAALKLSPQHLPSLLMLGLIHGDAEQLAEAEAALVRARALAPDHPLVLINLASILRRQHRYADAEPLVRRAVAVAPQSKDAWLLLGNLMGDLSRHEESIQAFQTAIQHDPLDRDAHRNLARRLWTLGRLDNVFDAIYAVMRAQPKSARALDIAAELQAEFGFVDAAMQNCALALSLAPTDPSVLRRQSSLLLRADRPSEAIPLLRQLLGAHPDNLSLHNDLALALLRSGDRPGARDAARRTLTAFPYDQYSLALLGTLGRLDGDSDDGDINDCVAVFDLPAPQGWGDLDRFVAETLTLLDRLHDTVNEPIHLTLRKGTQTSANLFAQRDDAPIVALREQILATVRAYVDAMPDSPEHSYFGRRGKGLAFAGSWSSRLRDGGFHTHHIHPEGWISGVYYLQVPPAADTGDQSGWLTFGVPNLGPEVSLPALRAVQPKPGRLVLFPSYFWHGTVPFQDEIPRITIAFDLVPA